MWVQSWGLEDTLEEGIAAMSSILAWRIPTDRGPWQAAMSMGLQKSQTSLSDGAHIHTRQTMSLKLLIMN